MVITGLGGTCPGITSDVATLNVVLQPTASIAFNDASYCTSLTGTVPINLSGTNAYLNGDFTSQAGLTLNALTGAITPSTSTPGTYTVYYAMPASICSISPVSTSVTINPDTVGGTALGYLDTETIADARTVLTVCHMGDGTVFASGYTGTINEWQYSTDGGLTWITYSLTSNSSINFANLVDTTLFRAEIESGNCGIEYTERVLLNVIPPDVRPDPVTWSADTICFGDSVLFIAQSGLGTNLGLEDGGGDFNIGQLNTQDPDGWLVDGNPGGWTADADNTAPSNDWSGTNPHVFGGILYDTGVTSGPKKFGIVNGPTTTVLETPIFNTYGLTEFEFQMDQAWNLLAGDQILIELSLDGGATYNVTLQDIIGPADSGNHDNFQVNHFVFTEDIYGNSLISYLGQDNLRIRFTYIGTQPTSSWAIDDIQFEVDDTANGIEWTNDQNFIISTENSAYVTPPFPGAHTFGVTSLIDGCRSEGIDGTVFVDIDVNNVNAGPDQAFSQGECGNNTITLNAYDNTLTVAQNFANGTFGAYDTSDPDSMHPGTGDIGTWSIISGPPSTCGTGTFSDVNDPRATFTGEPGTYVLAYTVGLCVDTVTIDLTTCDTIDFDGINDYITFKNAYPLNSAFSLEVWIKSEVNNGSIQTIFSKRNADNLNDGYDLRLVNRRISFNWRNGQSILSPFNINTDRWYHVAVTFNGGTYKLYIDGIEVQTANGLAPNINNNNSLLGAMDRIGQPSNYFNGWMDELKIWDKALSKQHIRQMMNQEIIDNGGAVRGNIVPLNIEGPDTNGDSVDDNIISWSNLLGYYKMDTIGCGYLYPNNTTGIDGKLRNITTVQPQTAPIPYTTIGNGGWKDVSASTPWLYGNSVWDYPNSTGVNNATIDWNIVVSSHNLSSGNKEIQLLGLLLDTPNTTLTIAEPTEALNENNSGHGLYISHYLELEGNIDLVGESQLIQKRYDSDQLSGSYYNPINSGHLKRDQQGTTNLYNYNYWSSPVFPIGSTTLNDDYSISSILQDGTLSSNPLALQWTGGYDATGSTLPITLSNYWLFSYENYPNNVDPQLTYAEWRYLSETGTLNVGLGYTMKGSAVGDPINDVQNYAFIGKPNNSTITTPITAGNQALVGNPYASAIDANEFIRDNILGGNTGTSSSIDGTVYFWEHYTSNFTHILELYEGGYATYNLTGGLGAVIPPLISGVGVSTKTPGRYIPVAQGFFVTALSSPGGDVTFHNDQRTFVRESSGISVFMDVYEGDDSSVRATESTDNGGDDAEVDLIKRVRLDAKTPEGATRPLLLGFVPDNMANDDFNVGYDAENTDEFPSDFSWIIGEKYFTIQGVGDFNTQKRYPLNVRLSTPGDIEISLNSVENFDEDINVYLHDTTLNTYTLLSDQVYHINLAANDYGKRFFITFENEEDALNIDTNIVDSIMVNYLNDSNEIYLGLPNSIEVSEISLINILGQHIMTFESDEFKMVNSNEIRIPVKSIAEGAYVIKVESNLGSTSKKVIIKF